MTDPRNRRKGKGGSGKISQHNPDLTAAATKEFLNRAGINPKNVILWNVVSSWNGTIRVNPEEIHRAIDDVNSLLKILKNLKTVILVGLRAQKLSKYLNLEGYNVGASLHPSPRNRARFPDRWRQIPMVWREIVGPELKNKKARKAQTRDKKLEKNPQKNRDKLVKRLINSTKPRYSSYANSARRHVTGSTRRSGTSPIYVGWDVGAWYAQKDAVAFLSEDGEIIGIPEVRNLSDMIRKSKSLRELLKNLAMQCSKTERDRRRLDTGRIVLAIDAPLGMPIAARTLFSGGKSYEISTENFRKNELLFRKTETYLAERGHKPMSMIQDMIGSQATKAVYMLRKFNFKMDDNGVWTSNRLVVIETYPSACPKGFRVGRSKNYTDQDDAITCARVARYYDKARHQLHAPIDNLPTNEGWIWIPKNFTKWLPTL